MYTNISDRRKGDGIPLFVVIHICQQKSLIEALYILYLMPMPNCFKIRTYVSLSLIEFPCARVRRNAIIQNISVRANFPYENFKEMKELYFGGK